MLGGVCFLTAPRGQGSPQPGSTRHLAPQPASRPHGDASAQSKGSSKASVRLPPSGSPLTQISGCSELSGGGAAAGPQPCPVRFWLIPGAGALWGSEEGSRYIHVRHLGNRPGLRGRPCSHLNGVNACGLPWAGGASSLVIGVPASRGLSPCGGPALVGECVCSRGLRLLRRCLGRAPASVMSHVCACEMRRIHTP